MPINAHVRRVLFITGPVKSEDDEALSNHLKKLLGYHVTPLDCRVATAAKVNRRKTSLIIISPTATEQVSAVFRDITVPVVVMNSRLYAGMGLTGTSKVRDFGSESKQRQVLILEPNHPIAVDLLGSQELTSVPTDMSWGLPGRRARRVVTLTTDTSKAVLFCYDSDDPMVGLNAPARRVAILYDRAFRENSGGLYWRLFDAAVEWAAAERPRRFPDVFRAEWSEIRTRRLANRRTSEAGHASPPTRPPADLAGLALSGGGIRAATFSLGLLQAMNRHGLLRAFDYLSTVSGGGYVGGWWSAWLSRDPREQRGCEGEIFPPIELTKPTGEMGAGLDTRLANDEVADELLSAGRDPVHHLRLFSNYLTPRKGLLSPDTWRAVTIISRDMVLTWVVLLPVLIAALLLGKLYFVLQPLAYDTQSHQSFFQHTLPAGQTLWDWVLWPRLVMVMWPLLLVVGWIAVAVCAWMISGGGEESRREWWAGKLGGTMAAIMGGLFFYLFYFRGGAGGPGAPVWFWPGLVGGSLLLLAYCFYPSARRIAVEQRGGEEQAARQWRGDVLRYRIARAQSQLIVLLAITAFVLVLAGFGHELVNYVLEPRSGAVARAGGWLAVLAALAGSVFTALKNSPSGGSDERLLDENQSVFNRVVFRLTPPLLIVVLAVFLSWAANLLLGYIHGVYLSEMTLIPNGSVYLRAKLWLVKHRQGGSNLTTLLMAATCLGALLSFFLVLVETRWRNVWPRRWLATFWMALALYMVAMLGWMLAVAPYPPERCETEPIVTFLLQVCDRPDGSTKGTLNWACLSNWEVCLDRRVFGALFFLSYVTGWWLIARLRAGERRSRPRLVSATLILLVGVLLTVLTGWGVKTAYNTAELAKGAVITRPAARPDPAARPLSADEQAEAAERRKAEEAKKSEDEQMWVPLWFTVVLGGAILYCLLFVILETVLGSTDNRRAMWLLTSVYLALNALLAVYLAFDYSDLLADYLNQSRLNLYVTVVMGQATFGLFGVSLTWVVAMGWMADPNRLSLHHFYRARLVRAYLGASNKYRSEQLKTIREAVEGDDVLLQDLGNCKRGGPYHLVNTTLNLVGGRDLTTAQRSADSFVLSKRFCGSSRTGYRDTREYMGGRLSLGTAVAVSGAAASPNMGSRTLTSSLAMLMTFLNVRLGYWAPTPNKKDWRETKARLWPFYMLREFTSQTNDLSTYCYLTDGGHFDNTGLYSLVERGCLFIVVADCGADPKPCFQDVGDALRRCRIDFGSEIDLDLAPITRDKETGLTPSHFAVGSIVYSSEHAEALGWEPPPTDGLDPDEAQRARELARTGVIILFKPAVTSQDEPADVRQFKLENTVFPQQTTADQWFDEAQFESYRRLGNLSAYSLLRQMRMERPAPAGAAPGPGDVRRLFREASVKFDPRSPFKERRQQLTPEEADGLFRLLLPHLL